MDITYPKLQSLAPGAYSVGDGSGSVLGDPTETPQVTGWIIVFSASPHRVSALLSLGQGGSPGVYVTSGVDRDNWVKIS